MDIIKTSQAKITIFNSLDELTVERWFEFQYWCLHDEGIGDLNNLPQQFNRLDNYLAAGDAKNALNVRRNIQFNFFFGLQKLSPVSMAFACLVKEIDGMPCDDLSEDGLRKTVEKIKASKYNMSLLRKAIDYIKKKTETQESAILPQKVSSNKIDLYGRYKQYIIATIDRFINETKETLDAEVFAYRRLLERAPNPVFDPNNELNQPRLMRLSQNEAVMYLEQNNIHNVYKLTGEQFLYKIKILSDQAEKQKHKPKK